MAYPVEIRQKVSDILTARRERSAAELAKRRARILHSVPEITALERDLATTSIKLSRALLEGGDVEKKVAEIKAFNLAKQDEISSALQKAGFSPDDLLPHHSCPLCKDTGYHDGIMCKCVSELQKGLMYERLGGVADISGCGFERFSLDYYPDEPAAPGSPSPRAVMGRILSECQKYADSFCSSSDSMLFCGKPGLGKTHLSLAIAKAAVDKGFDVMYLPFNSLISTLAAARFGKGSEDYLVLLEPVKRCELLILDDLGSELSNAFTSSVLYDIISERFSASLPTIISTNLTTGEIADRYGDRIASRLIGCCRCFIFLGSDIRLQKKALI